MKEKRMLTEFNRGEHYSAHPLDRAEAELDATVRSLENQLQQARQILARIRSAKTGTPENETQVVISGQYAGQRAIDALENYLRARKGQRIPLDRCVQDLIAGGANTGEPRGRSSDPVRRMTHNLKIAIPNRSETFGWEPMAYSRKGLPAIPRRGPGRKGKDVSVTVWLSEETEVGKRKKR